MVGLCAPSVLRGPVCKKTLFRMSKGFVCVFFCLCVYFVFVVFMAPSVLRGPVCKKTLFWMSKGFVCVFVCVCLFCVCGFYGPVCVEGTSLQKDNLSDE